MATGNPKTAGETLHDALVLYDPFSESKVVVTPHTLKVELGRTATWLIEVPADLHVSFSFANFPDPNGPFSSFSIDQSGSTRLATGTHLGDVTPGQLIHYTVTVTDAQGSPVGGDDPVIEPLDPPDEPPRA